MESTEDIEIRQEMVKKHDFFLEKIECAMKEQRYIEASWLIYSCLENRYSRTILKFNEKCSNCTEESTCKKNRLLISTKIRCIKHLAESKVECVSENFSMELFNKTFDWLDRRNKLMHLLLESYNYTLTDEKFQKLAEDGNHILKETYESITKFRSKFYEAGYEFDFPEEAMKKCKCKPRKNKKENNYV
ncbi:MAG: hypothetical protein LUH08_02635 [Ruminococcus sp.]|nr:hypothetical protein [Ruminococcus sp.]